MIPPHPDHPSADEPLSGDPAAGTNDEPGRFTAPGEVVFVRQLPGPIERVWAFLTEPGKRARWLAGGPMELRVGGRVELQFRHETLAAVPEPVPEKYQQGGCGGGCGHALVGQVTRCEPPRLLAFTWEMDEGARDGSGSEVTFELTPGAEGVVQLLLRHVRLGEDRDRLTSVAAGWHTHVGLMIAQLRGEAPGPFWSTHARLEAAYAAQLASGAASGAAGAVAPADEATGSPAARC